MYRRDLPAPVPAAGEVLIRVKACGLNNTDINTRSGWYSKDVTEATTGAAHAQVSDTDSTWGGAGITFPRIQGADVCGIVEGVGAGVGEALIGKRVITDNWLRDASHPDNMDKAGYYGSERDGGYAEYTTLPLTNIGVIDCGLSDAELATFSCSYSTAEGMLNRANVTPRDRVLITGASGGVGSALIQLVKRRGAMAIAMASEGKHDALQALEPDALLPRSPQDLPAALEAATGHRDVTVVADVVGGPFFTNLINALARGGRYTCSGAIAGPIVALDLRTFYLRDLTFTGSTVVAPHVFTDLIGYIERGEIKALVAKTFPLSEIKAAQEAFIAKTHIGNIVVIP
ncbi:MAG: alcohol dehydrogenase family protein [Pseudomonadota bacterium]